MQSSTANIIALPGTSKSDSARVGVAVISFPDTCTPLFCFTLANALCAGLVRDAVLWRDRGSHFKNIFSVSVITVPFPSRGAAVESINKTLKEVELFSKAAIATRTADDTWLTIQGIGQGGIDFENMFLKPEDIQACQVILEKHASDSELMLRLAIEAMNGRAPGEGSDREVK